MSIAALLPHSLVGRVALTCAIGFVVSGVSVALVTGVLSDRLARQQEDDHLRDAAGTFALELEAPGADPHYVAEDETRELAHTGMRLAVFAGPAFVSGDRGVGLIAAKQCADQGPLRGCGEQAGPWTAVIVRDSRPLLEHRSTTRRAAGIAIVITSLLGALLALTVARAVIRPLRRLREAVQSVNDHDPAVVDLGPDDGVAEVDGLRATLRSAFSRLGVALNQSRRFASDAAHQLRTPLTAVLGELDLAAERAGPGPLEEIQRAQKVARRLTTLIDRLLILARGDTLLQAAEEVDLLDVIEDAIETQPSSLRARVQHAAACTRVWGDRALLVAMLENALENALKFSSGPVTVTLETSAAGALLAVEDEGPGVPEAEQARVFAPFYRARNERTSHVPGHGLGLALIAHVAGLHRGEARFATRAQGAKLLMVLGDVAEVPARL